MTQSSAAGAAGRFAPGAWRLATLPVLLALPLAFVAPLAVPVVAAVGAAAVLFFHRDPDRDPPVAGVLAPADGTVSVIRTDEDGRLRVGTYMSGLDVHVNRAPTGGDVTSVEHRPGANKLAFSKDSERNERVRVELETGEPTGDADPGVPTGPYTVDLIAGAFARRIHPYVERGDAVARGARLGHISFGSRVDVVFPRGIDRSALQVTSGDTVTAGETVLAQVDDERG